MKLGVYGIRDSAVQAYMRPFYARTDAEAVRSVQDILKDGSHPLAQHPEDYELYKFGTFSEESGLFEVGVPEGVVSLRALSVASVKE